MWSSRGGLVPQWMTERHWRAPLLWTDTADLNIKTWCKMVIKSQLQLLSMKSQLSVSGAFCHGNDRESREQRGKGRIQRRKAKGKMKESGWEQTQLSWGGCRRQQPCDYSVAQSDRQTSSAVETGFLPFPSACSHELWTICLKAAFN